MPDASDSYEGYYTLAYSPSPRGVNYFEVAFEHAVESPRKKRSTEKVTKSSPWYSGPCSRKDET